jgi:DNA-binding MarR family transcriptional regulator
MAMKLEGGERLVLKTLLDLQGKSNEYVKDGSLAAATKIDVQDMRDWLETLEGKGFVERARRTDGFTAFVTASGRLALSQSRPFPVSPPKTSVATTSNPHASFVTQSGRAIDSSGNWIVLGDHFFDSKQVSQRGGIVTVVIHSRTAEDDAAIQSLGSARKGAGSIAYAYRNDALVVKVQDVESESSDEGVDWIITLKPKNNEYGGRPTEMATTVNPKHYSAYEIAELRASRILLNDPPPMARNPRGFDEQSMLDSLIRGTGVYLPVDRCILRDLYARFGNDPMLYLRLARLGAIYALKAGDAIETVERLALGPIHDGRVHVSFAGKRQKLYSNKAPHVIQIEGDCPLE